MNLIVESFFNIIVLWKKGNKKIKLSIVAASLFAILGGFFKVLGEFYYIYDKIAVVSFIIAGSIFYILNMYYNFQLKKDSVEKIEEAEKDIKEHPNQAWPLWDLSRIRLEMYFEKNLSQINSIYWITLLVMFAGFAMIGFAIYKSIENSTEVTAIFVSAISGVLTEVIGATFLVIYKSTMAQAMSYVQTLERINAVGMSIQILDTMPENTTELKNQARADLVTKLLTLYEPKSSQA